MKIFKLKDFTKGWFIGNFDPSLLKTNNFEVSIKRYTKGDKEQEHYHKVASEYTVIIDGKFRFNSTVVARDDIVFLSQNEKNVFECIESGNTVVVKVPSIADDKYLVNKK